MATIDVRVNQAAKRIDDPVKFSNWVNSLPGTERTQARRYILNSGFNLLTDFWKSANAVPIPTANQRGLTAAKNIKRADTFLGKMVSENQRRLQTAITNLETRMINATLAFQTSDGILEGPRVNLKVMQKTQRDMAKIFDQTYGEAVRQEVAGFSGIEELIERNFSDLQIPMQFAGVDRSMIAQLENETFVQFNSFAQNADARMQEAMYDAVLGGGTHADLTRTIQGIFTGHRDIRGRPMSTYASQYAFDSVMNFHNSVNNAKAEEAGLEHFLYVGDIIATSRPFCVKRAGNVYSKKDIQSWDFTWKGKSGPAFSHRGGYNCRHHWTGVDPDWFKEEEIPSITPDPKTDTNQEDWIPVANVTEGRAQLRNKYKIDNVEVMAGISKSSRVDYFNEVGDEMARMVRQNPGLGEMLALKKVSKVKSVQFWNDSDQLSMADYGVVKKGLGGTYNAGTKRVRVALNSGFNNNVKSGKLIIGGMNNAEGYLDIFRHEIGHHANYQHIPITFGAWKKFYEKKGKGWFQQNVSMYAGTNAKEAYAESFAAFTHPDYGKNNMRLPREVDQIFTKGFSK